MLYRVIQTKLLQEPVLAQCAPPPAPHPTSSRTSPVIILPSPNVLRSWRKRRRNGTSVRLVLPTSQLHFCHHTIALWTQQPSNIRWGVYNNFTILAKWPIVGQSFFFGSCHLHFCFQHFYNSKLRQNTKPKQVLKEESNFWLFCVYDHLTLSACIVFSFKATFPRI